MKKILSAALAALFAGTVAVLAGNIPNIATPTDPSQIVSIFNTLIQSINNGAVYGIAPGNYVSVAVPTGTGTSAQNLGTFTLPANYMATVKGIRFRCSGIKAANADNVTAQIIFGGTAFVSPALSAVSAAPWVLEGTVTRTGVNAQSFYGIATFGAVQTAFGGVMAITDTAAITVTCTVTDGTSAAADATMELFSAENVQ